MNRRHPRDLDYRIAIVDCLNRYDSMIDDSGYQGLESLSGFIVEIRSKLQTYPLERLNRWLGYVQGALIARGLTTVEAERDWTRPLFRPLDFPGSAASDLGLPPEDPFPRVVREARSVERDLSHEPRWGVALAIFAVILGVCLVGGFVGAHLASFLGGPPASLGSYAACVGVLGLAVVAATLIVWPGRE